VIKASVKSKGGASILDHIVLNFTSMGVLVGVPEETSNRKEGEVTNAQLMFIHSQGSDLQSIPKRPVIEPAIEAPDNKERITRELSQASKAMLDGDKQRAASFLKRAGQAGANAARSWFTDPRNGWPENTEAVAARKRKKGKGEKVRPLIDKEELRKSITWVPKGL